MTADQNQATRSSNRDPVRFVETLAMLLKSSAVYPGQHPRVRQPALDLSQQLQLWIRPPSWFVVRTRGEDFVLDNVSVDATHPLVTWMQDQLREAGLAGIEFGPAADVESIVEFARVLGGSNVRAGRSFAVQWPANHAKIRPLDLVFAGHHGDGGVGSDDDPDAAGTGDGVVEGTGSIHEEGSVSGSHAASEDGERLWQSTELAGDASQDLWKRDVVRSLAGTDDIQQRLRVIERQFAQTGCGETKVGVDLIASIVDLLPIEVASNPDLVGSIVARALEEVQLAAAKIVRDGDEVLGAEMTRKALAVAKKYFGKSASGVLDPESLPTGRPGDEKITADLDELLLDIDSLPPCDDLALADSDQLTAEAPELAAELCGIYMKILSSSDRGESLDALGQIMRRLLAALPSDRLQVVDAYLSSAAGQIDDETRLRLIEFLVAQGWGELIVERGYLDAQLMERTFPRPVPLYTRLLGGSPDRLQVLRKSLATLGWQRLKAGIEALSESGRLGDPSVFGPLAATGGDLALLCIRRLGHVDTPDARRAVVAFLRTQNLPAAESAAMRFVEPVESLPLSYLRVLCQMVDDCLQSDNRARMYSGQILRAYAVDREGRNPLTRRLAAISALRHLPGRETRETLKQLANNGRFTRFSQAARTLRHKAREALSQLVNEKAAR